MVDRDADNAVLGFPNPGRITLILWNLLPLFINYRNIFHESRTSTATTCNNMDVAFVILGTCLSWTC